jgi:GNAT superfamily N-acetyltransferase
MTDARLVVHLDRWLGRWPARGEGLDIVGHPARDLPGWDGAVHPVIGVAAPRAGVLSVPPRFADAVRGLAALPGDRLLRALPAAVGLPGRPAGRGVFRWSTAPTALPDAGAWYPADHPLVPGWLRVFGGEVLLAVDPDSGTYLAGVGVKRHDEAGRELSVGTEEAARGRGLARRLVAQAARRVLDEGAIPTYLHDPENIASARVATAAGFPDRGWTIIGTAPVPAADAALRG